VPAFSLSLSLTYNTHMHTVGLHTPVRCQSAGKPAGKGSKKVVDPARSPHQVLIWEKWEINRSPRVSVPADLVTYADLHRDLSKTAESRVVLEKERAALAFKAKEGWSPKDSGHTNPIHVPRQNDDNSWFWVRSKASTVTTALPPALKKCLMTHTGSVWLVVMCDGKRAADSLDSPLCGHARPATCTKPHDRMLHCGNCQYCHRIGILCTVPRDNAPDDTGAVTFFGSVFFNVACPLARMMYN
jgi:hypothetical protein